MDSRNIWLLALCVLVVVPVVSAAAANYDITGADSIDTPDRTVTLDGQEYTVKSLSTVDSSSSVTVEATVPSGNAYDINLYSPDNQIVIRKDKTGSGSATLDLSGFEAGSYAAGLYDESSIQAAHPVLIPGYDVTLSAPSSVTEGGSIDASGSVSARSIDKHSTLSYVEVVIGDDADAVTKTVSQSTGDYSATISTSGLDPGTYTVMTTVRGTEKVRQRDELLGIETATLTIDSPSTPTATPTPTDSGGSDGSNTGGSDGGSTGGGSSGGGSGGGATGGGGQGGGTMGGTTTPGATPTPTDTEEPTGTPGSTSTPTRITTSETPGPTPSQRTARQQTQKPPQTTASPPAPSDDAQGSSPEGRTAAPTPTNTRSAVITPESSATRGTTPGADGPGFTAMVAVVVLAVFTVRHMWQ